MSNCDFKRGLSCVCSDTSHIDTARAVIPAFFLALLLVPAFAPAAEITFDSARSYGYLKEICDIGPRVSGSEGMTQQQRLLIKHFQSLGADMKAQRFDVAHPVSGVPVRMTNLVVSFDPTAKERVLICCHYDTRPFPDRDLLRPKGVFVGANDGASGVALLMELGNQMNSIRPRYGVDFIFFDGEELVFKEGDKYFLGSEYFAKWYAEAKPGYRYVAGVLVDMIADRSLQLYMEKNSLSKAPDVTRSVWAVAKRVGVKEFIGREKYEVRDDHLALNDIAKIPTCNIIDFDYKYWHTTRDTPLQCSAASLGKVGKVLLHWMVEVPITP
ncbi:MAG: M28 family peptidase [Planctomycetota bacterium]|nr:M28 family peptidase [Planctomycetota bacterium]MDA1249379.1 M28 family peptidase [Planctomycetota bacterium]